MNGLVENSGPVLLEAAVVERLRRNPDVDLHPSLINAPLIYDRLGSVVLADVYRDYIHVAGASGMPLLMCTPTWRANHQRVHAGAVPLSINADAVRFVQAIRQEYPHGQDAITIGGMIGCKNDCYRPEQGLSADEAAAFHTWQIDDLARAGVDVLMAVTLPGVEEALGMARAMGASGMPYLISFVISRNGRMLDGSRLMDAIDRIDAAVDRPPFGYLVNCAYPTFLCAGDPPPRLFTRLIGYQANASSLDHCDLEGADQVHAEPVAIWGDDMIALSREFGLRILGGCCGTGTEHLSYLATHWT